MLRIFLSLSSLKEKIKNFEAKNLQVETESQTRVELLEKRLEQREKREKYLENRLDRQAEVLKDKTVQIKVFQEKIRESEETLSRFQKTAKVRMRVQAAALIIQILMSGFF